MSTAPLEPIRVLQVDDDPDFADLTATFLERHDDRFSVESVTSAHDGLERLGEDVDCVISDYDMPGMDGIEFLETVREDYPDLPFILFTGKGSEEVASEAISAGVTDYLQKITGTSNYAVLANRIENAVDQYYAESRAKKHERELERQNDLFEKAQDLASVGAWEYDFRTGEPYWTDEVARIHGLSPDYDQGLEEAFEFYHPEDRPVLREAFDRACDEGEPYDLTLRLIRADGEQRWIRTRGEPKFEEDELVCIRGSFQDVTEYVEQRQELRRFEAIIEALDEAVYAVDQDGRIEYVNERYAEMKGVEREELLGTPIAEWAGDDVADDIGELVDRLEEGSLDVGKMDYEFRTVDGDRIPAEVRFTDLEFPDGQRGRVGVIRDVTERRERERELERQNDRLDEFVSVVSHDLRNPLNTLSLSLDAIETDDDDHLARCRRSVERMDRLIEDLLTLARQGETVSDREPVDLRDAAGESWRTVESPGVELTVETDATVLAHEGRLKQLLENLFRNAVEHGSTGSRPGADDSVEQSSAVGRASDGGSVGGDSVTELRVGSLNGGFYVADDGVGIPSGNREVVFESGYSTSSDGTGFGLNIVERIATAHGWEVRATDSADGGARFEVTDVETGRQ